MFKTLLTSCLLVGTATTAQAGTTESCTRLAIDTAIDIPAAPEVIWEVLADTARYPEWNPCRPAAPGCTTPTFSRACSSRSPISTRSSRAMFE
jgi:hypothetical protein